MGFVLIYELILTDHELDLFTPRSGCPIRIGRALTAFTSLVVVLLWHRYGQGRIAATSNVLLSNGEYDPWRGGGVTANISHSVTALVIPKSAHHLDLRSSNVLDPPEVTAARNEEAAIIAQWLKDAIK